MPSCNIFYVRVSESGVIHFEIDAGVFKSVKVGNFSQPGFASTFHRPIYQSLSIRSRTNVVKNITSENLSQESYILIGHSQGWGFSHVAPNFTAWLCQ